MANSFTPHLNIEKPEVGAASNSWGGATNADWDIVDAIFAPDGSGTPVGLKIGAATTATAAMMLMIAGIMTGTGSANMLGMSSVDVTGSTFGIHDATDSSRIVRISAAAINTGSTRTLTMPDADITAVGAANTQTISNKTLTAPIINSPVINTATLSVATTGISFLGTLTGTMNLLAAATATGTLLMPGGLTTDTIAALTATQTLTHKSMDGAANTFTNIPLATAVTGTLPASSLPYAAPLYIFTSTNPSGTTAIPADNTIPQITEGNAIAAFATSYTALNAAHRIRVTVSGALGNSADILCVALFIDGASNAVVSQFFRSPDGFPYAFNLRYEAVLAAGSHTYAVRAGANSGGGVFINGISGVQYGNGTNGAVLTIEELVT